MNIGLKFMIYFLSRWLHKLAINLNILAKEQIILIINLIAHSLLDYISFVAFESATHSPKIHSNRGVRCKLHTSPVLALLQRSRHYLSEQITTLSAAADHVVSCAACTDAILYTQLLMDKITGGVSFKGIHNLNVVADSRS